MSQNTDHYQLVTSPTLSSSPTNQNNKRLPSHQQFLPSSSDFNTPSCTIQNDSSSPQSYTVRYIRPSIYKREKENVRIVQLFFFPLPTQEETIV